MICYASDRIESPNEDRGYDWKIETDRYADVFLDPASLGRPAGSSVYVSLQGVQATNTFTLDTTFGDTSTTGEQSYLYKQHTDSCSYPEIIIAM